MKAYEDIKAYLDGELTPEQAAVVERLLADDPNAAAEAESFGAISESLRSLARTPQPVGLDATVDRILRPRWSLWPAVGACAAVVLLGLIGPRLLGDLSPLGAAKIADSASPPERARSVPSESELLQPGSSPASMNDKTPSPGTRERGGIAADVETKEAAALPNLRTERATFQSEPPPVLNGKREVIRNADLGVKVKDASTALAELLRSTEALGGYFENSNLQVNQEKPIATVRLRVPSERFEAAVSMVRGLGKVERENLSGVDVTAQVVDYGARARVLANEEQALIDMLRNTRNVSALIEIRRRLVSVRSELESYNSQLKALKSLSSLSSISVELTQDLGAGDSLAAADWFGKTAAVAVSALSAVGRIVAQGLVFLVVLSPIWVPVALGLRWYLRRQPRP